MNNKKQFILEKGITAVMYTVIIAVETLYQLLVISLTDTTFDLNQFLFKSIFNIVVITAIFAVGYPDGVSDAKKQDGFINDAMAFKNKVKSITSNGKSQAFRVHCKVWNNNERYYSIKNYVEVECAVPFDYYFLTKKELRDKRRDDLISAKGLQKLEMVKDKGVYAPELYPNKILAMNIGKNKDDYDYNESAEVMKIIIPKIIQVILTSALFAINLTLGWEWNTSHILSSLGSMMSGGMAVMFSRKAGFSVISKRQAAFFKWGGVIDEFNAKPLTDKDLLSLSKEVHLNEKSNDVVATLPVSNNSDVVGTTNPIIQGTVPLDNQKSS